MQSGQAQFPQTVTIYKAPQKDKGKSYWTRGFNPLISPTILPTFRGVALAGPNDRSIAEEFNQNFKNAFLKF